MKKLYYVRQIITSCIVSCILSYFLFKTQGYISKIIILLFLIFALASLVSKMLLIFNKQKLSKKVSKIYKIAFLIYWYGFLLYWDYISLINKDYVAFFISLLFWIGGIYIKPYKKRTKFE